MLLNKNIKSITFSGLGGSGKSTQIKNICDSLKNKNITFFVFPMRGYFLWPRLAVFVKKFLNREKKIKNYQEGNNKKISNLMAGIRLFFYFLDFWRIYFIVLKKSKKSKIIIFDRYFYDFLIELNLSSKINHFFIYKFLPKPNISFYFKATPQTVYERKKEASLIFLEKQEEVYESFFKDKNVFIVNGEADLTDTSVKLTNLIFDIVIKFNDELSFLGFILFKTIEEKSFKYFEDHIFIIDIVKILKHASYNRVLWFMTRKIKESNISKPKIIDTILEKANGSYNLEKETIDFIKTNFDSKHISFAKNDKYKTELSGDVDIIFSKKQDYQNFKEIFLLKGIKVEVQNKNKFDIYPGNLKSIDVHLGLEFGNIQYLTKKQLEELSDSEISFLSIIAHAFSELAMFNWGDFYKLKNHEIDIVKVRNIAYQNKWGRLFDITLKILRSPENYDFNLPIFFKAKDLFQYRFNLFTVGKLNVVDFGKEVVVLMRCISARNKGYIPFHPQWFDSFDL